MIDPEFNAEEGSTRKGHVTDPENSQLGGDKPSKAPSLKSGVGSGPPNPPTEPE